MNSHFLRALFAASAFALSAPAQGTFQNLDFEAARVVFVEGQYIDASSALPGWMAYSGTNQLSQIAFNFYTHADAVELYGSNALVIGGNFTCP